MDYTQRLLEAAQAAGNIFCYGPDPELERIPIKGEDEEVIVKYFTELLEGFKSESITPAMAKPNSAFYEQYGLPGLRALKRVIKLYQNEDIMTCLDVKRADIGKTSTAYAKAAFDIFGADAITINPYLGKDSLDPFINRQGRGAYLLIRTSNPGAIDIQDLDVDGEPVYLKVAQKALEWQTPSLGGVVGATYPQEMKQILSVFTRTGTDLPLLIPGVGTQGGSVAEVLTAIEEADSDLALHRVNSSSAITYAYENEQTDDYVGAAIKKAKALVEQLKL